MTYDEALQKLHEKYPDDLVAIRYERSIHGSGNEASISPRITAYAGSKGWGNDQSNFVDAIAVLEASKDMHPEISDEV